MAKARAGVPGAERVQIPPTQRDFTLRRVGAVLVATALLVGGA